MHSPDLAETAPRAKAGPQRGLRRLGRLDAWFGVALDHIAAALVLAEILILFAGVTARYGFRSPVSALIFSAASFARMFIG